MCTAVNWGSEDADRDDREAVGHPPKGRSGKISEFGRLTTVKYYSMMAISDKLIKESRKAEKVMLRLIWRREFPRAIAAMKELELTRVAMRHFSDRRRNSRTQFIIEQGF
jgi:hypothetical protein